jgi:hypothetical protein
MDARPRRNRSLVDEPAVPLQEPVNRLVVDLDAVVTTKNGMNASVAEGGQGYDDFEDLLRKWMLRASGLRASD